MTSIIKNNELASPLIAETKADFSKFESDYDDNDVDNIDELVIFIIFLLF